MAGGPASKEGWGERRSGGEEEAVHHSVPISGAGGTRASTAGPGRGGAVVTGRQGQQGQRGAAMIPLAGREGEKIVTAPGRGGTGGASARRPRRRHSAPGTTA